MADDLDDIRAALARIPNPIALLENLFAFAPVGLQIYEASGRSLLVNKAFIELFGSEPPPGYNVLRDEIAKRNGVLGLIHRAFAGETVQVPPLWYDARELKQVKVLTGRRVAMSSTFFPLFGRDLKVSHVGIVFRDHTPEMVAREKAAEELARLEAIIEQSGDGICVLDQAGVVRLINGAGRRQGLRGAGLPRAEWIALHRLCAPDGSALAPERLPGSCALRGEACTGRVRLDREDGSAVVLSVTASPLLRADGSVNGAILTMREETGRASGGAGPA